MSDARPKYDPGKIEPERQAAWAEAGAYDTPDPEDGQAAVYIKPSSPFTSGNLHMGHVRDYSIGDAYARFRRARGDAVLLRLRLRRLRPAGRDGGDRARGAAGRLGRASAASGCSGR